MPAGGPAIITRDKATNGFRNHNSQSHIARDSSSRNGMLVIKEPTAIKPISPIHVPGKGKEIMDCPINSKSMITGFKFKSNEGEASSSSRMKIYVNRFGNLNKERFVVTEQGGSLSLERESVSLNLTGFSIPRNNKFELLAEIEEGNGEKNAEGDFHNEDPGIEEDPTIVEAPPCEQVNSISNIYSCPNDCDNLEDQGLTISSPLNKGIYELLVMDYLLNTEKSSNIDVSQCISLDQGNASENERNCRDNNLRPKEKVVVKKENVELGLNSNANENGELLEQGELPQKGKEKDLIIDFKSSSTSHFHSDAFTDTNELEISAKCFAKDENDISFNKFHNKCGKKGKILVLQSA
ncbi:hypothetical protein MA16_Dca006216 [Dendrobium catenatum]|uniref:Uncharacterized protein n=1 Tax=Dendrobium catenatum TaxID=906689 RepID=A0A2I0X4S3_9ASPA|nr:hypothetical protein MA16_Dca006216 [Dendrobium catenatum]